MPLDLKPGLEPLPGYHLLERLGKGGFGEVWKATAPGGFKVALKFVPLEDSASSIEIRSLDVIKDIRHANLLSTFGAWQERNTLIIAMELADQTLLDHFRVAKAQGNQGIPGPELLEYLMEAAKGIDYLNEPRHLNAAGEKVGIQHRDIKPQNLLMAGGSVKVGDFGLARVLQHSVTAHTGSMTLIYAAPEFFDGRTSSHSDQYSLAVTYCLLRGGRVPFDGSAAEVMSGHLKREPDLTMLPEDERAAVSRALAKDPKERWSNCREFARALQAAHVGPTAVLASAGVGVVSSSASPPGPVTESWHRKDDPSSFAVPDGRQENGPKGVAPEPIPETAQVSDLPTDVDRAGPAKPQHGQPFGASRQSTIIKLATICAVIVACGGLVLSLSGIFTANPPEDNPNAKSGPEKTSPPSGRMPGEIGRFDRHEGPVRSVAWTFGGRVALSGGDRGKIYLWDVAHRTEVYPLENHSDVVNCVAVSPDGGLALSGSDDHQVCLWDLQSRKILHVFQGHPNYVSGVAFAPDGKRAVSAGYDNLVILWDVDQKKKLREFRGYGSNTDFNSVAISPDGRRIAAAASNSFVYLWEAGSGNELQTFKGTRTDTNFYSAAFSPDGSRLAACGSDQKIWLWNVNTNQAAQTLEGHANEVRSIAFSPDGTRILSGSADRSVRLWNLSSGKEIHRLEGHTAPVMSVAFSPEGFHALSASLDQTVRYWRLPDSER